MKTESPTRMGSESASLASVASGGTTDTWMMEMSARGSEEITRAFTGSSPRNSTMISFIECTTWAAVATLPSAVISTPEPISLKRTTPWASTSSPRARITTTAGLTRRKVSPSVSAEPPAGAATTSASASVAVRQPPTITAPPPPGAPGSLGPAVEQKEGLHERARGREGPEPFLVDGPDLLRAVEDGQRAVHLRLEGVVPAAQHQRIRLVGVELATQPELGRVLRGGLQSREEEAVRGIGVEPSRLETLQALTMICDDRYLRRDARGGERGSQSLLGGRVPYHADTLAREVLDRAHARGDRGEQAAAVDHDHVTEGNLLHATESDRGGAALEVDGALGEPSHARGGRHGHPAHLEIRELEALLDGDRHLQAEIHRIAGRIPVGAEEGEGSGGFPVAELNGARFLDLVEGRTDLLGSCRSGKLEHDREGQEHGCHRGGH